MLTTEDILKHKKLIEEANEYTKKLNDIETEIKIKKQQAIDILKTHGYNSINDIPKLQEQLVELEASIEKARESAEAYILEASKVIEEKESILLG